MIKNENRARMYPVKLSGFHPTVYLDLKHRKRGQLMQLIIDSEGVVKTSRKRTCRYAREK